MDIQFEIASGESFNQYMDLNRVQSTKSKLSEGGPLFLSHSLFRCARKENGLDANWDFFFQY